MSYVDYGETIERLQHQLEQAEAEIKRVENILKRSVRYKLREQLTEKDAEIERLRAERDEARREWAETHLAWGKAEAKVERLLAERDAFKQTLYDELDGNLRLRELGGARTDEPMTTFLERVFAERKKFQAEVKRLRRAVRVALEYAGACPEYWCD